MKVSTIQKLIKEQIELGTNRDEIVVFLFTNHALSLGQAHKQVAKYMKDNNLVVKRIGFNAVYNDWLVDTQPNAKDAEAYVKKNGSDNVIKHLSHYLSLRDLAERAFAKGQVTADLEDKTESK